MKRTSCYILATLAVIMALNCRLSVQQMDPTRIFLPEENITCIEQEFNRTNTDPLCAIIEPELALLYQIGNAYYVVDAIESRLEQNFQSMLGQGINLFDIFCRQSCRQTYFEAWKSCGSFDELRNVANLLTSLCSASNGRPCYMDYSQLVSATHETFDCYHDVPAQFGDCAVDCRTTLLLDAQTYSCCLNVFHNYFDAIEVEDNEEVDRLFDECRVRRPAVCPTAPTMPDSTTVSPSPATTTSSTGNTQMNSNNQESGNPQSSEQGMRNGSSQTITVGGVLLMLNLLIAVFVQQI